MLTFYYELGEKPIVVYKYLYNNTIVTAIIDRHVAANIVRQMTTIIDHRFLIM